MICSVRKESITLMTEKRSAAGLTIMYPYLIEDLVLIPENMLLYMFNRIVVMPENQDQGEGSLLLRKICEIADEKQLAIFLGINAYGRLTTSQLRMWYERYGWRHLQEKLMIRFPK